MAMGKKNTRKIKGHCYYANLRGRKNENSLSILDDSDADRDAIRRSDLCEVATLCALLRRPSARFC